MNLYRWNNYFKL